MRFFVALRPKSGHGLYCLKFLDNTKRRNIVDRTSLYKLAACCGDFYLQNTTLTTKIHSPGGIRIHNLSRRAASELSLRLLGHWDR